MSQEQTIADRASEGYAKLFPELTLAQQQRLHRFGQRRTVSAGTVLFQQGDANVPFFVLISGRMQIFQPKQTGEESIVIHEPGEFTGETNMLSGRRSLVIGRMLTDGEVLEIPNEALRSIIQTEPDLSDIFMRAFILRRLELIQHGLGDVVLLGSQHSARTLEIREFLARNGHPFAYVDLDRDEGAQQMLEHFGVTTECIPIVVCRGKTILRNPTPQELADCLGFNATIDRGDVRDVIVIGAGPAGLAAAVYAASEGLNVLVLETNFPGGQAGSSSKIENYLGFPTGISGLELAGRAYTQAQKFGAEIIVARSAKELECTDRPYSIRLNDSQNISARSVIIATGARYNKLSVPELARFEGNGVYYGATFIEAQLCRDEEVIIVGGGNSAGQAAVFLAQSAKRVQLIVRSKGLAQSMSKYLIKRIEENPRIQLQTRTEIASLEGKDGLEAVVVRRKDAGREEKLIVRHIFVMAGASPNTPWLNGCLALDNKGFIKTGRDITPEDLDSSKWALSRQPLSLETTLPGVFAVGDVRSGNVKRVASAVGEGSIAVQMVHQVLLEQ